MANGTVKSFMKKEAVMEPLRALRNTLCSPKKYPAKSGTQGIRIFLSS
jgi:hypothetical protein